MDRKASHGGARVRLPQWLRFKVLPFDHFEKAPTLTPSRLSRKKSCSSKEVRAKAKGELGSWTCLGITMMRRAGGEGVSSCHHTRHGRSFKAIDSRIPAMPAPSMSGGGGVYSVCAWP